MFQYKKVRVLPYGLHFVRKMVTGKFNLSKSKFILLNTAMDGRETITVFVLYM